tara:strand:- start:3 stop:320 length:318 start_codon:yes stop_codon:yes gene_type:complete
MDIELIGASRLGCSKHNWEILRLTAGHNRIDRYLLNRTFDQRRRHNGDNFIPCSRGTCKHLRNSFLRGRDNWQTVRPPSIKHRFKFIFESRYLDTAALQRRSSEP